MGKNSPLGRSDSELLAFIKECLSVDSKDLRGFIKILRDLQDLQNLLLFEFFKRLERIIGAGFDLFGKMGEVDRSITCQQHRALEDILELPNIPAPPVFPQDLFCGRRDFFRGSSPSFRQEMMQEQRNIVGPFAQR